MKKHARKRDDEDGFLRRVSAFEAGCQLAASGIRHALQLRAILTTLSDISDRKAELIIDRVLILYPSPVHERMYQEGD